ncbi:MGMT family protein [Bacteriovoracaceae bacterium]|nr:MGMT family protein [Bacteriovoracaceae bacterium]
MASDIYSNILIVLKKIPKGKVSTYGRIAQLAGYEKCARQVAWFLHNSSKKEKLPWHRVLNSQGKIVLSTLEGQIKQSSLLSSEGVEVSDDGKVNLEKYLWKPKLM